MMNKVLLTGFEPFAHDCTNPSLEVIRHLDQVRIKNFEVIARELPCVFGEAVDVLIQAIEEIHPQIVICLGQAKGRAEISVERVAINIMDAVIPDNKKNQPVDVPIRPDGPVGLWSALPIKAIVSLLRKNGIPAIVSQTAGTYVCNQVFYGLMHWVMEKQSSVRAGFIHVPALPEQVTQSTDVSSMDLPLMLQGIRLAILATMENERDIRVTAGATH